MICSSRNVGVDAAVVDSEHVDDHRGSTYVLEENRHEICHIKFEIGGRSVTPIKNTSKQYTI